jgi:hypothetical protein
MRRGNGGVQFDEERIRDEQGQRAEQPDRERQCDRRAVRVKTQAGAQEREDGAGDEGQNGRPRDGFHFSLAMRVPPDFRVLVIALVEPIAHEQPIGQRCHETRGKHRQRDARPIHHAITPLVEPRGKHKEEPWLVREFGGPRSVVAAFNERTRRSAPLHATNIGQRR